MGRKRKLAPSPNDECLWRDSMTIPLSPEIKVQAIGLDSPTGTIFVRQQPTDTTAVSPENHPTLIQQCPLRYILEELESKLLVLLKPHKQSCTFDTLWSLGAIWIWDPSAVDRPQNRPTWQRCLSLGDKPVSSTDCRTPDSTPQSADFSFKAGMVLRMHLRPARFPMAEQFSLPQHIVYQNTTLGAVLVNKPPGLPSHATVDNATENVLHRVKQYCSVESASLPQRLDTETSGLLWAATRKSFASYMGQILQSGSKGSLVPPSNGAVEGGIQKQYRCLVCFASLESWQQLESYRKQSLVVSHYVDASSSAPKDFVVNIPENVGGPEGNDKSKPTKWQKCQLKIIGVTNPQPLIHENIEDTDLTVELWGDKKNKPHSARLVAQVEVELLTGRTHQIRGQLSLMDCPIVGDPLYGGTLERVGGSGGGGGGGGERPFRMALQCFHSSVVIPKVMLDEGSSSKSKGKRDSEYTTLEFTLGEAWWSDALLKVQEH